MNFNEMVEKCGFGLTVVLCENILEESFWNGLTMDECLVVYNSAEKGSGLRARLLKIIGNFKMSFEEWKETYHRVAKNLELREVMLQSVGNLDLTFEEWHDLCWKDSYSYNDKILRKISIEKMWERAQSDRELYLVSIRTLFCGKSEFCGKSDELIWEKALQFKFNFHECKNVYEHMKKIADYKTEKIILEKMLDLATTFREWIYIYGATSGELQERALKKAVSLAVNEREWLCLGREVHGSVDFKEKVKKK